MERLFGILMATGWFALISGLWLGSVSLSALFLLQHLFGFNPLLPTSWQMLEQGFQSGQAVPLGFILLCLALGALGMIGEAALMARLPAIAGRLPPPALPRLPLKLPKLPSLSKHSAGKRGAANPRQPAPPPAPCAPPIPEPAPRPVPPAPQAGAAETQESDDSAVLARILALFEVWNEPPPSWMADALRDEIHLLSPKAWPTLETLGCHGLDLLVTLQEHGMLPESPAALKAIGEVEAVLRAGLAAEAAAPEAAAAAFPVLTLAASWLCEALENFLAAQAAGQPATGQLPMAQAMLEQAMRGMREDDWASLDIFPEKASRVRVLTDQLREEIRTAGPPRPAEPVAAVAQPAQRSLPPANPVQAPATPLATVIALLEQFGFTLELGGLGLFEAPLVAQRHDLLLLLQAIDLGQKSWRLPHGLLGSWFSQQEDMILPGRQLWQFLARRRLRHADPRPMAGLLLLLDGKLEQEELLAENVAADRRRSGIGLAWLTNTGSRLPSLERELGELSEQMTRERSLHRSRDYSAAPS